MMTKHPASIDDVYASFGRAADTAQALEVESGNVALGMLAVFVNQQYASEHESRLACAVFDDLNSKTLGALLKLVKEITHLDVETDRRLADALNRRNYSRHNFFRSSGNPE